jgi:hypothetical protein
MCFRWAAAITLWTFLSGPIFGPPTASQFPYRQETRAAGLVRPSVKRVTDSRHNVKVARALAQ